MSKLDEIQERIEKLPQRMTATTAVNSILEILYDIVSELKRIDAEQKSLGKVVTDLSDIHP